MRVFISADIEGNAFTTVWDETRKGQADYLPAVRQMTAEVKAACEGAIAAGADYCEGYDDHTGTRAQSIDVSSPFRGGKRQVFAQVFF